MPVERVVGTSTLIDVLDRVLDKGIVIDAWVRVSLVGIDLLTEGVRLVVATSRTHLVHAEPDAPRSGGQPPADPVVGLSTAEYWPQAGDWVRVRGEGRVLLVLGVNGSDLLVADDSGGERWLPMSAVILVSRGR